jgi:hypothetical protein
MYGVGDLTIRNEHMNSGQKGLSLYGKMEWGSKWLDKIRSAPISNNSGFKWK